MRSAKSLSSSNINHLTQRYLKKVYFSTFKNNKIRLLIVSATYSEIENSIPYLDKHNIPYLITGVGMVATTHALTKYLSKNTCDYIINVGIAGAFDKNLKIGSVVEVNKDIFSELGTEDGETFIEIDTMGFGKAIYENIKNDKTITSLPSYTAITVNTVHGNIQSINKLKNRLPNVEIESMEGAAIFYVAEQFKTSSIQIRAISNYVEKRNKLNWDIPIAVKNLNLWLYNYLEKLIN